VPEPPPPMKAGQHDNLPMRVASICLVVVSVGILGFGVVTVLPPVSGHNLLIIANGLASIGLGLFGGLIALIPFRRGERWAWSALWFYPIFWIVHLVGRLPPGKDHIHQVAFIALSLIGLLLPLREVFRRDGVET
jgi:succinate-acetate transporter protein